MVKLTAKKLEKAGFVKSDKNNKDTGYRYAKDTRQNNVRDDAWWLSYYDSDLDVTVFIYTGTSYIIKDLKEIKTMLYETMELENKREKPNE